MRRLFFFLFFTFSSTSIVLAQNEYAPAVEEGYKDIQGVKLYYRIIGSGEPIVILHGGPGLSMNYFFPWMNELAKTHKLIFYDQRGCGKSDMSFDPKQMTLTHMVEEIEEMRKEFGIEKMILLGHSFGGLLAENYAIKYPEHLKMLILDNPSAHTSEYTIMTSEALKKRYTENDKLNREKILRSSEFQQEKPAAYERLYKNTFKVSFYDTTQLEKLSLDLPADFSARVIQMRNLKPDAWFYQLGSQLSVILCPVLIIHGSHDLLPQEALDDLSERLLNARVETIDKCGHFPFIEQPRQYFELVRSFLKSAQK